MDNSGVLTGEYEETVCGVKLLSNNFIDTSEYDENAYLALTAAENKLESWNNGQVPPEKKSL